MVSRFAARALIVRALVTTNKKKHFAIDELVLDTECYHVHTADESVNLMN